MSDRPSNVVTALSAVMARLPGIGKDQTASSQQGGYAYRGIEQITQQVQPLLAEFGVVFVPRVESWDVREIVVNGKPWTDTHIMVAYDVYGPTGTEDRITVGPILAIGRDNSDKGANKCMTQAFKYALLQALCISDAKDDADGQAHERDSQPVEDPAVPGLRSSIKAAIEKLDDDAKSALKDWLREQNLPPVRRMTAAQCELVIDHLMAAPAEVVSGEAGDREAPGGGGDNGATTEPPADVATSPDTGSGEPF